METLSNDILSLIDELEDDLDVGTEEEEDECGWGLFGWEGPDED